MSPEQIVSGQILVNAAVASARALGMPAEFAEISAAQAALESDWGLLMSGEHNVFGIKADGYNGGSYTGVATHEAGSDGKLIPTEAKFENYVSLEECFSDHARIFLSGPLSAKYYRWKLVSGNALRLAQAISPPSVKPLYATDPEYAIKIASILGMKEFQAMFAQADGTEVQS